MWKGKLLGFVAVMLINVVQAQLTLENYDPSTIKKINLVDSRGRNTLISPDSLTRPAVYVFLSPECPLCKRYTRELRQLRSDYGSRIFIVGIISGSAYSPEEVKKYQQDYNLNFPLYIDRKKELTNYMGATVTPEVVFLNTSGGTIYRGAIDNWVEELGRPRIKADKLYLENAIRNHSANIPVTIKRSTPKGCLINDF